MARLVNLGSLCVDHVYRVPNLSRAGETVASTGYETFPGGKGLNQSLAAARAGANVVHVGCVGADGRSLIDVLDQAGVDTSGIRISPDVRSGHAIIQVDARGENAIVISAGANHTITEADVRTAVDGLAPDDWLLLQNEISELPEVLTQAAGHLARVAFNVAPVDGREREYDLSAVDLLIVNEIEAGALLGRGATPQGTGTTLDAAATVSALTARCPDADIVMTLGSRGLVYAQQGRVQTMPAFPVTAVDETAAGDAFIGYLLAGLLDGRSLEQALRAGSAAGALTVTRPGAASAIPSRNAVMGKLGLPL